MVGLLLARGARIDAVAKDGTTVLMAAASGGLYDFVRLLLSWRADPRAVNSNGQTALDIARVKGFDKIAQLLEAP